MKALLVSFILFFMSSMTWAGGWSAIAYDTTNGKYGYAQGTYNKQQAESAAISGCNSLNCKVVIAVFNSHAALSVSKTNPAIYGTGYAPSKFEAMYWSIYYCNQGPTSCRVVISVYAHD